MPTVMIRIEPSVKIRLDALRVHPRETYGDIIIRLVDAFEGKDTGKGNPSLQDPIRYSTVYKTNGPANRSEIDID